MSARLATEIENAQRHIAALECSLCAYREGFPQAAAKVERQLDEAYRVLARLEAGE